MDVSFHRSSSVEERARGSCEGPHANSRICAVSMSARIATATVRVDCGAPRGPVRRIWTSLGFDEINWTSRPAGKRHLRTIGAFAERPYHVRSHYIFNSGIGWSLPHMGAGNVYHEDADGRPHYDFTIADQVYDAVVEAGLRPLVELAFTPRALVPEGAEARFRYEPSPTQWRARLPVARLRADRRPRARGAIAVQPQDAARGARGPRRGRGAPALPRSAVHRGRMRRLGARPLGLLRQRELRVPEQRLLSRLPVQAHEEAPGPEPSRRPPRSAGDDVELLLRGRALLRGNAKPLHRPGRGEARAERLSHARQAGSGPDRRRVEPRAAAQPARPRRDRHAR